MEEYKDLEDNEENRAKSIGELLISSVQIANQINKGALSNRSDSWRYLDIAKQVQLGAEGLGAEIHLHFKEAEEIDVKNWNPDMQAFLDKRARNNVAFKIAIEHSGLLEDEEKKILLGINEEAMRSIARDMQLFLEKGEEDEESKQAVEVS